MSGALHEGEIAMQRRVGVHARVAKLSDRLIRDHMPEPHRVFFEGLPFVVIGAVDDAGDAWASLLTGRPGFLRAPDARTLALDAWPDARDPLRPGFREGASVGLLGIELASRRRNRVNGTLRADPGGDPGGALRLEVVHSFGNCPQYIQTRALGAVDARPGEVSSAPDLSRLDRADIRAADTFYVASYVDVRGGRQVDVSHRGGNPGFVRVDDDGGLTIPDFAGNRLFNTLGNLLLNPRAGLVFVDWERGDLLQMTGRAEVRLDDPEAAAFEGAERLWRFLPTRVVRRPAALPLRARLVEPSPHNARTGAWIDVNRDAPGA